MDRSTIIRYLLGTASGIAALEFMPKFSFLNFFGLSASTNIYGGFTIGILLFLLLFAITIIIFRGKFL